MAQGWPWGSQVAVKENDEKDRIKEKKEPGLVIVVHPRH